MKKAIYTQEAPQAIGPYSQAVVCPPGQLLFVSGQLPLDPQTGLMPESVAEQTERSLLNLQAILVGAGATLADVVKTTVYLSDIRDFAEMNAVYSRFFGEPYPARAAVEVARLPKDAKVEIDAVAVRG